MLVWGWLSLRHVWSGDTWGLHINFVDLKSSPWGNSRVAVWHTCPGLDGQLDCHALSEQGGRNQIQKPGPQSVGDHSVVSTFSDYTVASPYFRMWQCQSRSPFLDSGSDCSVTDGLHRVVSVHQGSHSALRYLEPTYSRSVLHLAEQKGRGILLWPSRPPGSASQSPSQVDWSKGLLYI